MSYKINIYKLKVGQKLKIELNQIKLILKNIIFIKIS